MATFSKFNEFTLDLGNGVHNLGSDTIKAALTNTAPNATDDQLSDITEISAGNGYTSGGATVTVSSFSQSSGTATLALADTTITASGGTIGPFRYVVVYNDTATNDELIGYADYGSNVTLQDGEDFVIDFAAGSITI